MRFESDPTDKRPSFSTRFAFTFPSKKKKITTQNLGKTIRTQRILQNGDDLLPKHPPSKDAKYFETSNSIMYGKNPDSVRDKWTSRPLPEKGNDDRFIGGYAAKCNPNDEYNRPFYSESRYFFKTGSIEKDSYEKSMFAAQPRGKCGRGASSCGPQRSLGPSSAPLSGQTSMDREGSPDEGSA